MPSINIYLPDNIYNYIAAEAQKKNSKAATLVVDLIKEHVGEILTIPEKLRKR